MSKTIDITLERTGTSVDVEYQDNLQNEILVSLSRGGVGTEVDNVAPSITVDFGSLPQNVYWDDIQDKPAFHEVATSGDYNDLENLPDLKPVATSGDYDDLTDLPSINSVTLQGNKSASELGLATAAQGTKADTAYQMPSGGIPATDLANGIRADLNKAHSAVQPSDLAMVAETGDYDDLLNKPTIPDVSGKADKVSGATNGNLAALDNSGNLVDSGKKASDFATLDSGGKVPSSQLPSYVDDVLEYTSLVQFPAIGESGKIYVALNTNKTYRWSGSAYVEISQSLALGETSSTAFPGDRGKAIEDKIPSSASSSNKLATASDVNGKLSAPATAGTSGQVLTSDGQGGQSWQTPQSGGTATDVQVNGTSITSNNVANIVTNTAYNASSNKIATMSDLPSVPVTDVTVGGTSVVSSGTAVIPAIPDVTGKADKVSNATSGNFASLDSNGNLADSGHKHSDYLTSHQDISGKEDKTNKVTSLSSSSTDTQYPSAKVVYDQLATKQATLVSGTNIKTINSTSLLGSGNIQINDGVGFQTITTQQDGTMVITLTNGDTITVDLNHTHPNYYKKTAETSQPSGGMLPDVTYKLGTLTGATTFSFAAAVSGNANHYYFTFTSGSTAVVPTWPESITSWDGDCVDSTTGLPVIAASKTYEVSVLDGNAIIKEW